MRRLRKVPITFKLVIGNTPILEHPLSVLYLLMNTVDNSTGIDRRHSGMMYTFLCARMFDDFHSEQYESMMLLDTGYGFKCGAKHGHKHVIKIGRKEYSIGTHIHIQPKEKVLQLVVPGVME